MRTAMFNTRRMRTAMWFGVILRLVRAADRAWPEKDNQPSPLWQ